MVKRFLHGKANVWGGKEKNLPGYSTLVLARRPNHHAAQQLIREGDYGAAVLIGSLHHDAAFAEGADGQGGIAGAFLLGQDLVSLVHLEHRVVGERHRFAGQIFRDVVGRVEVEARGFRIVVAVLEGDRVGQELGGDGV